MNVASAIIENAPLMKVFWDKTSPVITKAIGREFKKYEILFGKHLELSLRKNSHVKLLSSKTTPTKLSEVYVNNNFTCRGRDREVIIDDTFIEDIRHGERVVVRGNGGSGKTFFLKYFWNKIFNDPRGTIPVFIELRKFNEFQSSDLEVFIKYTITNGEELDDTIYRSLLKTGSLVIMLDGFDELVKSKRRDIERQVLSLEEKAPACPLIISSRANSMFEGWTNFSIYDVVGFNLKQVKELVEKSTVEDDTKKSFLKVLDDDFYSEHETFLEIPLLALMMLITFRDTASIPANLDAFYSAVFLTLYQNHDAMKESLDREKALGLVELQRLFAVFCFLTYIKEKYEFSKVEILEQISEAINFLNKNPEFNTPISAKPIEVLHDIEEAVNLICLDGLTYMFVHRSFQEYFTAYFVIKMEDSRTEELLKSFAKRNTDSVLRIAYQMKPATVLAKYVVPTYQNLSQKGAFDLVKSVKTANQASKICNFSLLIIPIIDNADGSNSRGLEIRVHNFAYGEWMRFRDTLTDFGLLERPRSKFSISKDIHKSLSEFEKGQFAEEVLKAQREHMLYEVDIYFNNPKLTFSAIRGIEEENKKGGIIYMPKRWNMTTDDVETIFSQEFLNYIRDLYIPIMNEFAKERRRYVSVLKGLESRQQQNEVTSLIEMYSS